MGETVVGKEGRSSKYHRGGLMELKEILRLGLILKMSDLSGPGKQERATHWS